MEVMVLRLGTRSICTDGLVEFMALGMLHSKSAWLNSHPANLDRVC